MISLNELSNGRDTSGPYEIPSNQYWKTTRLGKYNKIVLFSNNQHDETWYAMREFIYCSL
jgi:hypothetical protein